MNTDERIQQIAQGSREALKSLYTEFGTRVFNTALGLVQNKEDAQEITQDVFIEVAESAVNFRFQSKVSTWIYRITVNKSLDTIRHRKRAKRFAFLTSIFQKEMTTPIIDIPDFQHPGVLLENQEKSYILFKVIDELPKNQRTVFVLSQIEQLPQKQIASIMQMTEKGIESLLQRSKINLRKKLEEYYPERRK